MFAHTTQPDIEPMLFVNGMQIHEIADKMPTSTN